MAVGEDRHPIDGEQSFEQTKAMAGPPISGRSGVVIGGQPAAVAPDFRHCREFGHSGGRVNPRNEPGEIDFAGPFKAPPAPLYGSPPDRADALRVGSVRAEFPPCHRIEWPRFLAR